MGCFSNSNVWNGLLWLVPPFDAGFGVQLGIRIGSDEGVEQRVDRQCLGRVAQRGQKMRVEIRCQVQQIR